MVPGKQVILQYACQYSESRLEVTQEYWHNWHPRSSTGCQLISMPVKGLSNLFSQPTRHPECNYSSQPWKAKCSGGTRHHLVEKVQISYPLWSTSPSLDNSVSFLRKWCFKQDNKFSPYFVITRCFDDVQASIVFWYSAKQHVRRIRPCIYLSWVYTICNHLPLAKRCRHILQPRI